MDERISMAKPKASAKESKPSGAAAAKAKAKGGSGGRNGSRSLLQSPALRGAALAIVVALLALGVKRFWFAPQRSATTRVASNLYIPRDIPVDHKRFDVTCHMRKVRRDPYGNGSDCIRLTYPLVEIQGLYPGLPQGW
jgi:hypothetical protein